MVRFLDAMLMVIEALYLRVFEPAKEQPDAVRDLTSMAYGQLIDNEQKEIHRAR